MSAKGTSIWQAVPGSYGTQAATKIKNPHSSLRASNGPNTRLTHLRIAWCLGAHAPDGAANVGRRWL